MAFNRTYLYCVGPAAGPRRIWKYDTLDSLATVDTTGYFNSASKELAVGDEIHTLVWATAIGAGGTLSAAGICHVLSNASGVVDVSDHTALNIATDTD
jgi:hypothetical protein